MADARDIEIVKPYGGDPFVGHLSTPVSDSAFTKAFIGNLPAYRKGLSPILRGIEIGMAHGYFLIGPWIKYGPLRDYPEAANLGGLVSAMSLILIGTACMSVYGIASFQATGDDDYPSKNPQAPADLKTAEGWSQLTAGFFVGGMGGVFVSYFLLENLSGVDAIFRGLVN
ncbi:photosystem I reaction center protein subunit XI [Phormidium pseudopriestleyi FRX01]|uniref:Photosystem I reaction center subunit XI n=1 Tax=Phormidium pseudopriestleyi FRX01 TaxID=1759528 RepID=A0ABS3FQH4_9CYAN|nr:photosystem I reaction center protein subunit XI [Phormidium pseudopriestleyi]MBO0349375.1 photosystem I reaction center protein subunit XI [Phormidium pseudopriestleyi FRX01]